MGPASTTCCWLTAGGAKSNFSPAEQYKVHARSPAGSALGVPDPPHGALVQRYCNDERIEISLLIQRLLAIFERIRRRFHAAGSGWGFMA
jgi:hypothetical protein